MFEKLKQKAREIKRDTYALFLAYKDPRVPWYAKIWTALVVGYALSPIDLIPDFIPILGYLDDLLIVPFGITIALKMIPPEVMKECRKKSEAQGKTKGPKNWIAGGIVILIWALIIFLIAKAFIK